MLNTLWQYFTSKQEAIPARKLGPFKTDPAIYGKEPSSGLRVTWMGHSTLFIEIDGLRILTDPVWSKRVSFVSFAGPKRFFDPPLLLEQLPLPSLILISHDHYDHLDKKVIRFFASRKVPFLCPLGVGAYLRKWGVPPERITEVDWGNTVEPAPSYTITATPTRHFSGRGIVNRDHTLWCSFVIRSEKHTVFYGADSGWFDGFKEIGEKFGPFDLTMLEIGAYHENWPDIHMGPEKAANAHLDLRGALMLPIHWGTFNLALHAWDEPIKRLQQIAIEKNIRLLLPRPGEPCEVIGQPYNSNWWKKN